MFELISLSFRIVLEFMAGGQVVWQDDNKQPTLTIDEARRTFRDVVLGLEYCMLDSASSYSYTLAYNHDLQCTIKVSFIETSNLRISFGQKITRRSKFQISEFRMFRTPFYVQHQTTVPLRKVRTTKLYERLPEVLLSSLQNSAILPNIHPLLPLILHNLTSTKKTTATLTSPERSITLPFNPLLTTWSTLLQRVPTESLLPRNLSPFLSQFNHLLSLEHDLQ